MKKYEGVEVIASVFVTFASVGGKWSALRPWIEAEVG
jgi:hypothetical protein